MSEREKGVRWFVAPSLNRKFESCGLRIMQQSCSQTLWSHVLWPKTPTTPFTSTISTDPPQNLWMWLSKYQGKYVTSCQGDDEKGSGKCDTRVEYKMRWEIYHCVLFSSLLYSRCCITHETKIITWEKLIRFFIPRFPHNTEYCRNMSEIFPIFHCNWNIAATFLSIIPKYFSATSQF